MFPWDTAWSGEAGKVEPQHHRSLTDHILLPGREGAWAGDSIGVPKRSLEQTTWGATHRGPIPRAQALQEGDW